ncbi:MAG: mechanosensitive ion channel family protein [Planctomycetia bacterium]
MHHALFIAEITGSSVFAVPWGAEVVGAVVSAAFVCPLLPRGRRWLAWMPLTLVAGALLVAAGAAAFPGSSPVVAGFVRFFAIAAILQCLVLFVAVSIWEWFAAPLPKIFLDVMRWLAFAVAILVVAWEAGVDAGELLTGSALVTAVLGFALRDTLGNVFAGLAIHAEHPFEIGDWIQYDANPAHIGRVVEINWRATKVLTLDEAFVIIPNGQLAQASIRNFTKPEPWSRRSLFVITPYDVPPQRVQAIILDAIRGSFGVLEHPAPSVVTSDFKERGVEHWVRLFTTEFGKRDRVDGMARDRIWYALARHGIEIPVATQAIRLTQLPTPAAEPPQSAAERRERCLRQVGLLAALGPAHLHGLAADTVDRVYAAGEQVIRQGDSGSCMFVVMEGRVEVTAAAEHTAPVRVATLEAGDYFGEMSLMTGAPRVATVTALVETRLLEVGKESFGRVLTAQPALVERLGAALRERQVDRDQAIAGAERTVPEEQDVFRKIRDFFAV